MRSMWPKTAQIGVAVNKFSQRGGDNLTNRRGDIEEENCLSVYDVSSDHRKPTFTSLIFYDTDSFVWVEVSPTICMYFCME